MCQLVSSGEHIFFHIPSWAGTSLLLWPWLCQHYTVPYYGIQAYPVYRMGILHLWLQERGIGLPSFSGDPCPCSFRKAVNSSRVMLGLWTEEVSLGVRYSGYDRWYWVPPWLNLTVGLLAPQQGGIHAWVCVHMCGHVCVLEAARGRPVKCSKQFFSLFSLSPSSCCKGKLCTWWNQD